MDIIERKLQAQHIARLYQQIGYESYYNRINQILLLLINLIFQKLFLGLDSE